MEEALYIARFAFRGAVNQGIVVLETNRIYGGDSGYYYIGSYEAKDGKAIANIEIIHHNKAIPSIFGNFDRIPATINMQIVGDGTFIEGTMTALGQNVRISLEKKERLP